ncbi:MAG: hypothetical protein Q4A83_08880, partial [Bacillota bacterium]|nr:hypothetical protein [Bacillota bacterium]
SPVVEEEAILIDDSPIYDREGDFEVEERIRPLVLILYLIFAIPIGLALIGILAVIGIALLALSCYVGAVGVGVLSAAFSVNITVFADRLIVLGAGLVITAIGVILAWFSIWFMIVSFRGLFRGIVALGRKLCVKEVAVNG